MKYFRSLIYLPRMRLDLKRRLHVFNFFIGIYLIQRFAMFIYILVTEVFSL